MTESILGHIALIDDDQIAAGMLAYTLTAAGYQVSTYASGEIALAEIGALAASTVAALPEVIFVDIEMPGLDGYATCQQLKALPALNNRVVIFLSSHDALDDRLAAYDAGGDDFIAKPFATDEILRKAEIALRHVRKAQAAPPDQASALNAAMNAMTSLGETGIALRFSRQALACVTQASLARQIIATLASFTLEGHVQLRAPDATLTLTPRGPASPLEESVFEQVKALGRIFSFKNRMIVNHDSVSILITNMPLADAEFCGRIRDHIAVIAEAAVLAVDNIHARTAAVRRNEELVRISSVSGAAVERLRSAYREIQIATRLQLENMTQTLESMYYTLGLTDSQESTISATVHHTYESILDTLEQGAALDRDFAEIATTISDHSATINVDDSHSSGSNIELW